MDVSALILNAIIILAVGGVFLFFSFNVMRTNQVSARLKVYVEEESNKDAKRIQIASVSRQFSGSLANRVIVPALRNLVQLFGRLTPMTFLDELRRQLIIAGNPYNLGPREMFGLGVLFGLIGVWVGFVLLRSQTTMLMLLLAVLVVILSAMLPFLWLRSKVTSRQNRIRKGLPDALDMLSVCASAGLGFDQSLQRISDYWNTPIGAEFSRVIAEMEMGVARRDALRNMSDRLQVNELSSFVAFVLQSEQIGMSIADTLHAQAAQMRVERRFRAQEQAQKIPSKMLIPLIFLIFPALLAVILGPALPDLLSIFENI